MRRFVTLITTLALALSGLVFSPARASVPSDGTYLCTTGVASGSTPNYTITNGVVYDGGSCVGEVVLPAGVTSIGTSAFYGSALTGISIPSSVTGIANFAFSSAISLNSITIPESVLTIGRLAFDGADSLNSINVDGANANYSSIDGALFNKAATTLIAYPVGKSASEYAIPSSVITIGDCAFYGAHQLTGVTIPSSVITIGEYAFYDAASLESVTLPASVTSIGEAAFLLASSLTSVTLPASVTSIGNSAFSYTRSLTSIKIPSSVISIGAYAFAWATALKSITIPSSVNIIGDYALLGASSLASITVAGSNANYQSSEGVLFNKRTTSLITYPAARSGTEYSIPSSVTTIGNNAFSDTSSLTSVIIPPSVTSIGTSAFWKATALTSITIPASVTSIGDYAFESASSLASITVDSSNANYSSSDGVLFNKRNEKLITYPAAKSGTEYSIPPSVTSIGTTAFWKATALTGVTFPASVTSIGDYAFFGASSLTNVNFQGDAPSVGEDPFYGDATGAKAHIKLEATGFGTGSTWNGLVVDRAVLTPTPTPTPSVTPVPVKAVYASGAKLTGKAKVGKSVTVKTGSWTGTAPVTYKYQWYVCKSASKKVLTTGKAAPKCTLIKKATKASFKVTKKEKSGFLAVLITGANPTGKSTIFTATVGKVS